MNSFEVLERFGQQVPKLEATFIYSPLLVVGRHFI